jgi:hypothetical protein
MVNIKSIPGYMTLVEAEEAYGTKADTLKKRCQKGEVKGAKKIGKTWFVPNIPNVDPSKTIPENYPGLNFDAAYLSNLSLYDAESDTRLILYKKHGSSIYIWEYGFYFFSLIFNHAIHRSYLPLAALITEAQSALRCSFLLNLNGYHSDAFALLRKAHESIIKTLASKKQPQKMGKIGFGTGRGRAESIIGVNFERVWSLESSFNHSNVMKFFEAWKNVQNSNKKIGVAYGPQINNKQFGAAISTSIFWLYVLIQSLPYIFPDQLSEYWLRQKSESAKLMKDRLVSLKAFKTELINFDKCIDALLISA